MDEIIAGVIHHIDLRVSVHAVTNAADRRTQIDADDDTSKQPSVGSGDRSGSLKGWNVRRFDDAGLSVEIDLGDKNLVGGKADRLLEIVLVALAPQLGVRHHANRASRARTIDAQKFTSAVLNPDHLKLQIIRLAGKLGRKTTAHQGSQLEFLRARGGGGAVQMAHHQIMDADRGQEPDRVGAYPAKRSLQYHRRQAGVGLHPIQCPRQYQHHDVTIGQKAQGGRRQQHQRDHGERHASRQFHGNALGMKCNHLACSIAAQSASGSLIQGPQGCATQVAIPPRSHRRCK